MVTLLSLCSVPYLLMLLYCYWKKKMIKNCCKSIRTASAYTSTPHTSLWASGLIRIKLLGRCIGKLEFDSVSDDNDEGLESSSEVAKISWTAVYCCLCMLLSIPLLHNCKGLWLWHDESPWLFQATLNEAKVQLIGHTHTAVHTSKAHSLHPVHHRLSICKIGSSTQQNASYYTVKRFTVTLLWYTRLPYYRYVKDGNRIIDASVKDGYRISDTWKTVTV
jgi:hypothetical protein